MSSFVFVRRPVGAMSVGNWRVSALVHHRSSDSVFLVCGKWVRIFINIIILKFVEVKWKPENQSFFYYILPRRERAWCIALMTYNQSHSNVRKLSLNLKYENTHRIEACVILICLFKTARYRQFDKFKFACFNSSFLETRDGHLSRYILMFPSPIILALSVYKNICMGWIKKRLQESIAKLWIMTILHGIFTYLSYTIYTIQLQGYRCTNCRQMTTRKS